MTSPETVPARAAKLRALVELGKLRLAALAVFAVAAGLYLGSDEPPPRSLVVPCVLGTLLVAAGGNALNMYLEREADRRMRRTLGRPLPSGRLAPRTVLVFGLLTAAAGIAALALTTNGLATALCGLVFVTYVLVYTPLKRVTVLNTLVGAIPGALPPVVGYTAATGALDGRAVVLFLVLFLWQIPHFLAIAWRYRDDYERGGMKMLPVVDPAGHSTRRQMVIYTVALIAVTLFAYTIGLSGPLYLAAAISLGILFLASVLFVAVLRTESAVRLCFLTSIIYLPLLLVVMVLDR